MKSRIKFVETEYTVNAEEKKVTCTCTCVIDLKSFGFWKFMNKIDASEFGDNACGAIFACSQINKILDKYGEDDGFVEFTVVGVAKCDDKDEFDETLGRHIANTRAQEKAEREVAVMYNELVIAINKGMIGELVGVTLNCMDNAYAIHRHENELLGIKNPDNEVDDNNAKDKYNLNNFRRIFEKWEI